MQEKTYKIARSCVSQYFGMSQSQDYFEKSFGLDSSLCLTTKKLPTAAAGATMTPKCCVTPVQSNPQNCQVTCTLYGVK